MGTAVDITIIPFDPAFAKAFADLNYAWIRRYFAVEGQDRELLDHPGENIIDKGGEIFFAVVSGRPAGTAALINASNDAFELAKMAVSPEFRRLGIADRLIEACIAHARHCGKKKIFLLSNTILGAAINLYIKHGFTEVTLDEQSPYERVNIRMELAIGDGRM